MIDRGITGEKLHKDEFERQIRDYRNKYEKLITGLGSHDIGTEVLRRRTLEIDLDIRPNHFVRDAVHEFIFPSQVDVELVDTDEAGEIPDTRPYTLTVESGKAEFDPHAVKGRIKVNYDDAGYRPELKITDLLGNSELSEKVISELDTAIPVVSQQPAV